MQIILLLLYPFVNAVLNRWPRGTYSWGPWPVAAILAVLVFLITFNYFAAGAMFALYVLGESFGWGKWLITVQYWDNKDYTQEMYMASPWPARDDGRIIGVHFLANLICKEEKDFRGYAWWALVFRGIVWYAPIYIALAFLGAVSPFIVPFAILAVGFMFPISYSLAHKMFGDATYWTKGEIIYGFIQGLAMAIALATGVLL